MADARAKRIGWAVAVVLVSGLTGWRWLRSPAPRRTPSMTSEQDDRHAPPRLAAGAIERSGPSVATPRPGLTEGGVLLSGRVLEGGGGPIAGARVSARTVGRQPVVFGVDCDGTGSYRIRIPPDRYLVEASASGYTRGHAFLELRADENRDFQLEPGAHIDGRVVTADGQPVPGAQVIAAPEHFGGGRASYGPVVSDAAGAFRVDELAPGSYRLAARKEELVGTADRPVAVASAGAAGGVVITVAAGIAVTGTVKTQAGAPIAKAEISFTAQQSALLFLARQQATSDEQGRYRIEGLGPGEYRARAESSAHTRQEDAVTLSGSTTHDFVLGDGALVTALVLDGAERPVAGAVVRVQTVPDRAGRAGFDIDEGVTDGQGRFTFKPLEGDKLTVTASTREALGSAGPLALAEAREVTVRLAAGARLSGTVAWDDGNPAAGVILLAQGNHLAAQHALARSGARGEFALGPFPAGAIEVSLRAPGEVGPSLDDGPLHGKVTLAAGEQRTGVKLILSRKTSSIAGVVLGPDNLPLPGVTLQAARTEDDGALLSGDGDGRGRAVTGGDGAFVIEGLPPGPVNVLARHPQHPSLLRTGVAAGTRNLRLRLQRGAVLEGVVVTAQGAPVTSYRLNAGPHERDEASVRTDWLTGVREPQEVQDRAGAFRLERVAAGSYDLVAFTEDGRVAHLEAVVVAEGEHRKGLRLVLDDRLTVPGGLEKNRMRATMIGK